MKLQLGPADARIRRLGDILMIRKNRDKTELLPEGDRPRQISRRTNGRDGAKHWRNLAETHRLGKSWQMKTRQFFAIEDET